jgi:Skp family chaperone for outer membrane proteins
MKNQLVTIIASVVISITLSGIVATQMVEQHAEMRREFKVVDVAALSEALMTNLEAELSKNESELNPEMIKFIAKQEAKKLYTQIALHEKGNNIVLPKQSVIYAPDVFDITQSVSDRMGLGKIEKTGLNRLLDEEAPTNE